ncbi:MAG: pentapeptide repeat protein [Solimicrobium sp.]|jgi:uncharacterized protein YjbI with pentapeptide repeats|nr:pentapeptide repeat protein [Solimicrobium sp.]
MQSINSQPFFSQSSSEMTNLRNRIEENRPLIDDLRKNSGFQNIFALMRKKDIPNELIFGFLTGTASLEQCLNNEIWMINLLERIYDGFEIYWGGNQRASHFLDKSLANRLLTIFKQGYFESNEKTYSKMHILIGAIEKSNNSKELNLQQARLARVNLTGADLSGTNLHRVDLTLANLTGVNLNKAVLGEIKLRQANLTGANLSNADLKNVDLTGVNLTDANLSEANLSQAKLCNACLTGANLTEAQLYLADLTGADLSRANLTQADLDAANLAGANLQLADLRDAKLNEVILTDANLLDTKSNDPDICFMIRKHEQAYEEQKLLSSLRGEFVEAHSPQKLFDTLPGELI